jgi:hypothetical protein
MFFVSGRTYKPAPGLFDGVARSDRAAWSRVRVRIGARCVDGTRTRRPKGCDDGLDVEPPEVTHVDAGDASLAAHSIEGGRVHAERVGERSPVDKGRRRSGCRRVAPVERLALPSHAAARTRSSRAERRSLGAIGSPVLRRVVRSFGSTREALAPSVTDRGNVPVDALGRGLSARPRDLRHAGRVSVHRQRAVAGERRSPGRRRRRARECTRLARRRMDRGGALRPVAARAVI